MAELFLIERPAVDGGHEPTLPHLAGVAARGLKPSGGRGWILMLPPTVPGVLRDIDASPLLVVA
jgi:hypothetical protein